MHWASRQILRDEYKVVIAGGQGDLTDKIFRIGHLGWVEEKDIKEVLDAIKKALPKVDVKTGLKPEELKSIIGNYDAIVVRSETQVTPEIIKAGTKLQVIARAGVGLDN